MADKGKARDDSLLEAMLYDTISLSERRSRPEFLGFLDEREQELVKRELKKVKNLRNENYMFWGGFDTSERVVFGAFPACVPRNTGDFPIRPVTFRYRKQDILTHRDFLGSVMSLGIERQTVGDILTEEGRCVMFLRSEIADYVLTQIDKVGSVGVRLEDRAEEPYPAGRKFLNSRIVVSSLRADCVAAACTGFSREKIKRMILSGLILVNYQPVRSGADLLTSGDKLTIRGTGKFLLSDVLGYTKKGRIGIELTKYIS